MDSDAIINSQTRAQCRTHEQPAIWTPGALGAVVDLEVGDLLQGASVPDIDLAGQVAETSDAQEPTLRIEGYVVSRQRTKFVQNVQTEIEKGRLGGHPSIRYSEFLSTACGVPGKVANTPFFVKD